MGFIRILKNVWRTDSRCSLERRTAKIEHVGDGNQAPMFVFSQRSNGRIHTVRLCAGLADKDAGREWWGVSCCQNLSARVWDWQAGSLTSVADKQTETLQFEPGLSDECIFSLLFTPSWAQQVCANCTRLPHVFFPIGALTVSLRFPLYLSGCKSSSSSSSVWCQQCWLIKAVGRQCVIHSYSWHMYYSRLNTYN